MCAMLDATTMSMGSDTERVVPPTCVEYEELGSCNSPHFIMYPTDKNYQNDVEFATIIHEAELALENGILPELIKRGSSGAYFSKNREGVRHIKYF